MRAWDALVTACTVDMPLIVQHGNTLFFPSFMPILESSVKRRHPDTTAQSAVCLYGLPGGKRIDLAAMHTIHAEAAETLSLWQCLTDEAGTVVAAEVIRFEHHGTIAGRHGLFGKSVFIHRPFA